jgi:hypothetical protein
VGAHISRSLSLLLVGACGGELRYAVDQTAVAPEGASQAVLYHGMGGGAAGVCTRGVLVLPASAAPPTSEALRAARDSAAFRIGCGSRVELRWRAADTLEVKYTTDATGMQVWQRAVAGDGQTRVVYVISER